MKILHVLARNAKVRGVKFVQHIEFLAHQIAAKTNGPRAIIVVNVAVNLIFIKPFGQQMPDNDIYFGASGVISKASRVGHHATIHGNGGLPTEHFETS